MSTLRMSATKARNNFFSLLDEVVQGAQVIIEKDREEVAVISARRKGIDLNGLLKASEETHGILKNYDLGDNPLRKKGSSDFLGRWDRVIRKRKS